MPPVQLPGSKVKSVPDARAIEVTSRSCRPRLVTVELPWWPASAAADCRSPPWHPTARRSRPPPVRLPAVRAVPGGSRRRPQSPRTGSVAQLHGQRVFACISKGDDPQHFPTGSAFEHRGIRLLVDRPSPDTSRPLKMLMSSDAVAATALNGASEGPAGAADPGGPKCGNPRRGPGLQTTTEPRCLPTPGDLLHVGAARSRSCRGPRR